MSEPNPSEHRWSVDHTSDRYSMPASCAELDVYLEQIGRTELLTEEDERKLALSLRRLRRDYLSTMLSEVSVLRRCIASLADVHKRECRMDAVIEVSEAQSTKTCRIRQFLPSMLRKLRALLNRAVQHDPGVYHCEALKCRGHLRRVLGLRRAAFNLLDGLIRPQVVRRHWNDVIAGKPGSEDATPCNEVRTWIRRRLTGIESKLNAASQELARHNLRLVVSVAKQFQRRGNSLADLIQDGNVGLLIAVEKFDPSHACRFSTYATWWIREMIQRGLRTHGRTIRVTASGQKLQQRFTRASSDLLNRDGFVNDYQIEQELALSFEDRQAICSLQPIVSLNCLLQEGECDELGHIQVDHRVASPYDEINRMEQKLCLLDSLMSHEPREQRIISMRFGLDGNKEHTYEGIAAELSLSRQGVAKIEKKTLQELALNLGKQHKVSSSHQAR